MEIYFGSTFLRTTHLESLGWDSFLDGMDTVQKIGVTMLFYPSWAVEL